MSNEYFDSADYTGPSANTLARASTVQAIADAVEAGFDLLPTEDNIKKGKITYAVDTGAADAYLVAMPHAPAAYGDGLVVDVKILNTSTGASTIDVDSLGAVAIKRYDGTAIQANDLLAGAFVSFRHNGTNFRMTGPPGADAANAATSATAAAADAVSTAADAVSTAADVVSTNADVVTAAASETNASNAQTSAETAQTAAELAETNAQSSEDDATTAQTAAESAQTSAETAQTAAEAAQTAAVNAAGWKYNFDNSTSMADPGSGDFRLNNATVASVTAIAIDALAADTGSPDVSDYIATWDDSDSTVLRGTITIRKIATPATFAIFSVTGAVVDNTGWLQLAVTHVLSNGAWTNTDPAIIHFVRTGEKGSAGAPGNVYDAALIAGFDVSMVKEDIAVATYGEWVMARSGSFTGEAGYIDTAPTGAAAIVDIEKNGTTIYTTKPEFAAASNSLSAGTLKTDGTEDYVSGDRVTFKVTQIGSTEPGEGLRFTVKAN